MTMTPPELRSAVSTQRRTMMNRTNVSLAMLLCVATVSMAACDEAGDPAEPTVDAAADYESTVVRGYELLSIVPLEEGGVIEFGQTERGGIVVVEYTPTGALSPIDTLMTGQEATPLEVFMAVAPPEEAIPAALIETHERFALDAGRSSEPRALLFEPLDPSFRANYDWYYAADCSLSADGAWFDDFWDFYNWNWHWYSRTNDYTKVSPAATNTHSVQAHLCNDGPSGAKDFWVVKSGPEGIECGSGIWFNVYWKFDVAVDHRAQFRAWEDPDACSYTAKADWIGSTPYPTYSLGITKP